MLHWTGFLALLAFGGRVPDYKQLEGGTSNILVEWVVHYSALFFGCMLIYLSQD